MRSRWALIPFLTLGVLVALAVYQVPQPWRGWLVTLLLAGAPVLWLVVWLVRVRYAHAEFMATVKAKETPRQRERRTYSKPSRALHVSQGGGGQEIA